MQPYMGRTLIILLLVILVVSNSPVCSESTTGFYPVVPSDIYRPECICDVCFRSAHWECDPYEGCGPPVDWSDVKIREYGQDKYNQLVLECIQGRYYHCMCTGTSPKTSPTSSAGTRPTTTYSGGSSSGSGGGSSGGGGGDGGGLGTAIIVGTGAVILIGGAAVLWNHVKNKGASPPSGGSQPPSSPPPTGRFADGRPRWGTGEAHDPYRDYAGPGRPLPSPPGPKPPAAPPKPPAPPQPPRAPARPPGPQHGATKTITDARGQPMEVTYDGSTGKWMTDHGTEVDLDRLDHARKDYVKDTDWSRQEHERIREKAAETARKSFEPPPKPPKSKATKEFEKWYKGYLDEKQKFDIKDRDIHIERGDLWDRWTNRAEFTQKFADYSIDALANVTGPVGKQIKLVYKAGKAYGGNLSKAYANGGSLLRGTIKGTADFGFELAWDKLKDKGLEKLSTTRLKGVPPFIKFPSSDISEIPVKDLLDLMEKTGQGKPLDIDGYLIARGLVEGTVKTGQDWTQKWIVKDHLKKKLLDDWLEKGLDYIVDK